MLTQTKTTGSTTVTGFSRNGFGCCARHMLCEMGKKSCYYAELDTELPMLCAAFKRHHLTSSVSIPRVSIPTFEPKLVLDATTVTESKLEEDDDGQLLLF